MPRGKEEAMNSAYGAMIELGAYFAVLFCVGLVWIRFEAKASAADGARRAASISPKQPTKSDSLTSAV